MSELNAGLPLGASARAAGSSTERAIDEAFASGEKRTVIALCAQDYGALIGRLCMAMVGIQEEAEELAQDTLLAAFTNLDEHRGDASWRAWLLGIARKKCLKHLERGRSFRAKLFLVPASEPKEGPDELLSHRQRADYARGALGRIKPSEREALLLRYSGELSFKGVARACGVEEPAARKRVSRALHSLRQVLENTESS